MSGTMAPSRARLAAALAVCAVLTACGGGSTAPASSPSVDPTTAQLQARLDALPAVDGAQRTARHVAGGTLSETFTVPAGTPACLQVLAPLDAAGYQVVAGATEDPVDATTCLTTQPTDPVSTAQGTASVLAQGGSQIALRWTATEYTLEVSTS